MQDCDIIKLFFDRDEHAIKETEAKYGDALLRIAENITFDASDAEECVNDTYLAAWNSIPPEKPVHLFAYLAKITRNQSYSFIETKTRKKRSAVIVELSRELSECIPSYSDIDKELRSEVLNRTIGEFVRSLDDGSQYVFMRRYFYSDSIRSISHSTGFSENKVKSMLMRIRKKLKKKLEKEDLYSI